MPTYDSAESFGHDLRKLSNAQKRAFFRAVVIFRGDLKAGRGFRPGLRVKKVQGHDDIWELTWGPDGRATFAYGDPVRDGHPHVIWRRIGSHDIFTRP